MTSSIFTIDPAAMAFEKAANLLIPQKSIWYNDPQAFVHDCIDFPPGEAPTDYQDEILGELPVRKRIAVRGPHGLGKTALESWVTLWFSTQREGAGEDWKVPTLASVWRQLDRFLWPEIHKWARRVRWDKLGMDPWRIQKELLDLNIKLRFGAAFALASDDPQSLEGAHADHILYLFDEAKAIPSPVFDAAEGAFSGSGADTVLEALALVVSTPGEPVGRFAEIHQRRPGTEDWWVRHVTVDEAMRAGRISSDWVEARRRQWGETSAVFQNRVLGEFATQSEDSVIPLKWVEDAIKRWEDFNSVIGTTDEEGNIIVLPNMSKVAVDVARTGEDKTVIAVRHGAFIKPLHKHSLASTMETAGQAVLRLGGSRNVPCAVDVIGIGAGVVDRLREQGYEVDAFNASSGTDLTDVTGELGFINRRAAAWWTMRELLDPINDMGVMLPNDDELIGDLVAPHWTITSAGKIKVESKDEIKKRLGRSTDCGDAVVMNFCPPEPEDYTAFAEYYEPIHIGAQV